MHIHVRIIHKALRELELKSMTPRHTCTTTLLLTVRYRRAFASFIFIPYIWIVFFLDMSFTLFSALLVKFCMYWEFPSHFNGSELYFILCEEIQVQRIILQDSHSICKTAQLIHFYWTSKFSKPKTIRNIHLDILLWKQWWRIRWSWCQWSKQPPLAEPVSNLSLWGKDFRLFLPESSWARSAYHVCDSNTWMGCLSSPGFIYWYINICSVYTNIQALTYKNNRWSASHSCQKFLVHNLRLSH